MEPTIFKVTSGLATGSTIEVHGELLLGRDASDGGTLGGDLALSRQHARLERRADGTVTITDLGSTNGTFVNDERVTRSTVLNPGDRVKVGETVLEVGDIAGLGRATVRIERAAVTPAAARPDDQTPPVAPRPPLQVRPTVAPAAFGAPAAHVAPAAPPLPPGAPLPAPRKGGPPAALIAGIVALIIGVVAGALLFSDDDDEATAADVGADADAEPADDAAPADDAEPADDAAPPGDAAPAGDAAADGRNFSLMAQGYSVETFDTESGQRELDIYMRVVGAPFGIERLTLDKYLDETGPPPQRTYDAVYTFTADNGDSISVVAEGDVTGPEGPDGVLAQTYETWHVVNGTGQFAGACGTGTITTAVAVASRGPVDAPTGSDVVKFIEGNVQLSENGEPIADCASPPPAAEDGSIGPYTFDTPELLTEAVEARRAAGRYINEPNAIADGFVPQPSEDDAVCTEAESGNGAIEYVNEENLADGEIDPARPDVLLYVPAEGAIRRLVGVQYRVPDGADPVTVLGEEVTSSQPLNAWFFLYNPNGLTAEGNPASTCEAGPAQDTPPIEPAAGGPPPGAGGPP